MKKLTLLLFIILIITANISYAGLANMPPATHRDSNNEIVLDSHSHGQSVFLDNGLVVCENDILTPYNPARKHRFIVYKLNFDESFLLFKEFFIVPMLVEIPANTDADLRPKVAFADPQSTGLPANSLQIMKHVDFTTKNIKFAPLKPINEIKMASDLQYYVWQGVTYIQNKGKNNG